MNNNKKFYKLEKGDFQICTPVLEFRDQKQQKNYIIYTLESEKGLKDPQDIYGAAYKGDLYNEPLFYELNLYERACLDYLIERINEISIDPDENFKSIELKDELLKTAVDEAVAGMTEVR